MEASSSEVKQRKEDPKDEGNERGRRKERRSTCRLLKLHHQVIKLDNNERNLIIIIFRATTEQWVRGSLGGVVCIGRKKDQDKFYRRPTTALERASAEEIIVLIKVLLSTFYGKKKLGRREKRVVVDRGNHRPRGVAGRARTAGLLRQPVFGWPFLALASRCL